jgi:hypothetical protein
LRLAAFEPACPIIACAHNHPFDKSLSAMASLRQAWATSK